MFESVRRVTHAVTRAPHHGQSTVTPRNPEREGSSAPGIEEASIDRCFAPPDESPPHARHVCSDVRTFPTVGAAIKAYGEETGIIAEAAEDE